MSRTQLQPLQLNSLPKAHEHDEYTARPGGNRNVPSWNNNPSNSSLSRSSMSDEESSSSTIDPNPGLPLGLSRPLNQVEQEKLAQLDRLKFFLATAPSRWDSSGSNTSSSSSDPYLNMGMGMNNGLLPHHTPAHPALNRFLLPTQEYVTCVYWNGLYHITGTDIVRALVFRFDAFGRPVRNMKKFEEGVFSDLRNLKPGQDASLEEPKSPFLDLLFKYQCIRTQKKQKVFYWFSVPHDRLFLDALERDLKREKMGLESTTQVVGEPALSFIYDGAFKRSLYEQFVKAAGGKDGEGELERVVRGLEEGDIGGFNGNKEDKAHADTQTGGTDNDTSGDESADSSDADGSKISKRKGVGAPAANNANSPFFNMFSLFEGSPTYKQRRKNKPTRPSALSSAALASTSSAQHSGMPEGMASRDEMMQTSDRYSYPPSGEQYASYTYGHDMRANIGYHPSSSPPGTTQFPTSHNTYGMDVGYGQGGYPSNGLHGAPVRVKQEPLSAADMFLMQAQGDPPNSRRSPLSTSDSPSSLLPAPEVSAAFPQPIAIPTSSSGAPTTIKAYACPLLSCGRLFKRMEHLKRHLRTHTMERPFVCTKKGCGKRFSRSDNLSQHLRVCKGARAGSSHSDTESNNLNTEGDSLGLSGMEWGVNVGEWINSEMDDESQSTVSSADRGTDVDMEMDIGQTKQPPTADIGVELNLFGGSGGLGMGMGMGASVISNDNYDDLASSTTSSDAPLDVPMELCEVELTGDVREVHGDEEGLVRVHVRGESGDEGYYTGESSYNTEPNPDRYNQQQSQQFYDSAGYMTTSTHRPQHHASLDSHLQSNARHLRAPSPRQSLDSHLDAQSQWALRNTPSPSFSTISVPSLSPNRNSWGAGTLPRPHSSYGSSELVYGVEDPSIPYHAASNNLPIPGMNLSVSAPSHKLAFDHSNLYTQGIQESSNASFAASMGGLSVDSVGGPVRRHRSMTPSLMRGVDGSFVRRPTSGGGSGDNMAVNAYHPYASSSRASSLSRGGGSVHSSPSGHPLPLPIVGMQRSESRASNLSVEVSGSDHLQQARQMLSRPGSVDPSASDAYPGGAYRTESPTPFANHLSTGPGSVTDSPATFVVDLPRHSSYQHPSHAATSPAQFGLLGADKQYSMQGVNSGSGNFYPHHVSTI
ncbi:STE-12 alpha [Lentinula detonsa]|uniref:STE-12 alpha n=1 Tax=Lentinula detonsa TaxID=2804962 RepID=A0A9W8P3P5_9AGAR|nr:STE-12 alpha [Lentinula detonsa]